MHLENIITFKITCILKSYIYMNFETILIKKKTTPNDEYR